jgi:hypothetical protein
MITLNPDELRPERTKDRSITFRLPEENFKKLKKIDRNVSVVLRYLIEAFLMEQADKEKESSAWNRKV